MRVSATPLRTAIHALALRISLDTFVKRTSMNALGCLVRTVQNVSIELAAITVYASHGFKGTNCEERFEDLSKRWLCIDGTDGYVCECPWGYSGPRCQDAELSTSGKTENTEITKSDCGDDGDGCLITTSGPFASCSLSSYCSRVFRNDICDEVCDTEPCMFDGFDCISKESKCPDSISAYCKERKGNGVCDEPCNRDACDFDGGDCREAFPELHSKLFCVAAAWRSIDSRTSEAKPLYCQHRQLFKFIKSIASNRCPN
ncbi:hypothetical protein KIN20_032787 [Parelaphostrongylus tenuis]|uniref:Uncharacterized protein n=1 Tax=Parelaphostrongylus tenuis TaxID=148309 RepID=A0AAD5R9D7_PARTN|nr:hypothetical protein KIN20_032787 [Parelaphostrongylus tenuis]